MLLALSGSSAVFAEETENNTRPSVSPLQKLRESVNLRKEAVDDKKEVKRNASSSTEVKKNEAAVNKINKNLEKMLERYRATIDREDAITLKINTRIGKIKALGGQTAEAEKLVAESVVHLDEAKVAFNTLSASVSALILEETATSTRTLAKDALTSMKKSGSEIEKHLREAHKALQKSVGSLKGVSQLKNASSTKED